MESPIDQRYRLLLLYHYLDDAAEKIVRHKWIFRCPHCAPIAPTEGKRTHRKGALFWNSASNSWIFSCARKGSPFCRDNMGFPRFISSLNRDLGDAYVRERWTSRTTGKGHNCPNPKRYPLNSNRIPGSSNENKEAKDYL